MQNESIFQVIKSNRFIEHIYSYSGQNYGSRDGLVLTCLNELSQTNNLILYRKQVSNREINIKLPENRYSFIQRSESDSPSYNNENYTKLIISASVSSSNYNNINNKEDEDDYYIQKANKLLLNKKGNTISNQFENNNYETFLYFFNKAAIACYLKLMKASQTIRAYYSTSQDDLSQTNFNILNENKTEKRLNHYIKDEEFITNYINLMVSMHMQIASQLYKQLNNNSSSSNSNGNSNKHVFKSFRIIGLRQKRKNKLDFRRKFTDVTDVRVAFDIKQYEKKTGYDCFIDCEFNYYKLTSSSVSLFNQNIAKI